MSACLRILTTSFFTLCFALNLACAENVTGKWYFDYGYYMEFFQSGNTFSGFGGEGSSYTWPVTNGVINGNQVSWHEQYNELPSYQVDRVGTISGDTITGTWTNTGANDHNPFTATRVSNGGPTPTPTPSGQNGKRPTATFIFCNRTGVGLSTADCSITVGDAGAPPRTTPSGTVSLAASNGFFPAIGSCALQQTQFSPGVASCKAEFAIPFGYPIGVPFPIDATYPGDATFGGSSTSHKSIEVSCVGDAAHPCSGNVALTFADWPQIVKNLISPYFECGNVAKPKALRLRGLFGDIGKCVGTVVSETKLGEVLSKMDLSQITNLAGSITNKDASSDIYLRALQGLDDPKYAELLRETTELQDLSIKRAEMSKLLIKIINDQSKASQNVINNLRQRRIARAKKSDVFTLGTGDIAVKNNSIKPVKIRLTKPAQKLVAALKKVGIGDITTNISLKGQRAAGPKKPFKKSYSTLIGLN